MSGSFGKQGGAHIFSKPGPKKEGLNFSHTESKEAFKKFYNGLAERGAQKNQKYIPEKMDIFRPHVKDPLIEFGCHVGMNFEMFSAEGCRDITGIDCGHGFIEKAKELHGNSSTVTLIEAFIEDLPEDKKYKTIVMIDVLEHVINADWILKKAKNLLDKDGLILYCSPIEREGSRSHVRGITEEEIYSWFHQNKLKIYKQLPNYGGNIRLIAQHEK
jgi:2-polyprenyl-3-methyl-5-hydroxy-6-metoxy-1,4-benzoquinol methylase